MAYIPKWKKVKQWDRINTTALSWSSKMENKSKRTVSWHSTLLVFNCFQIYYCIILRIRWLQLQRIFSSSRNLSRRSWNLIREARIVGDYTSTNVRMFKMWSPHSKLVHFIEHPSDENRRLFFSFDYADILKKYSKSSRLQKIWHLELSCVFKTTKVSATYPERLLENY